MTEIRHIVFDIGRVLIHYDPNIPFSRLIPDAEARKWFFDNVCTHDWNLEQDRGRTWAEAEALLVAEYPSHAENIRNFRRHWHEMVPHAYDDSVRIMETLIDAGHDVTLLTNFAVDTLAEARQRFDFLGRPRGVTVSGEIGLIKPDRAIYDHHIAAFGLEPSATLFIDDSQKNVDGAKAAGWQAVLFTDARTLKADLERLGIAV
ncbi:MAG: HAD family phosphatase [Mesorhizobium sp.]|uniref:HAD family hydrolase n=1 Tax=unclassified Mesorhizobium TaxID=325217 RepID=UPI000F763CB7|nr:MULTISPECIES: HAD family phosphatase [unclassified Mesorhizobium]AZO70885.1 HAD family phosphatase [Mesorhizobium sp. M1D.F.Ca.ET.043.01.1.1]RWA82328.1 MAG: HAD family phosphatase [Mesorhizobium sp.]RWE16807.1 MAG: HAD family phosphatase [Mesorhizobium sp.]TJW83755.1 MAG: HAD family phosphatase [Mesorhizobium sp.]